MFGEMTGRLRAIESNTFVTNSFDSFSLVWYAAGACILAETVLMLILPAVNFKSFTDKPSADFLCALPVTYRERFWGEFLSGLTVNIISFVPCAVILEIFMAITKNGPLKELSTKINEMPGHAPGEYYFPEIQDDLTGIAFKAVLTLLLGYIAAYCVGTLAVSCCGRVSSSIFTALGFTVAVSTLFVLTEAVVIFNAEGIQDDAPWSIFLFPPVSFLASVADCVNFDFQLFNGFFAITAPFYLIENLLVIAAVITGAYFLGKCRKIERTGHAFAYTIFYHVMMISFIALTADAVFLYYYFERDTVNWRYLGPNNIIFPFIIAFAVYMFIEFLRLRKSKALLKSVVRFIAAAGVCVLFNIVTEKTESFRLGYFVPDPALVKAVEIEGDYFYSGEYGYTYRNRDSIKTITEEHKKLVNASPVGGRDQWIIYYIKDGRVITRIYAETDDMVKEFSENVKKLPMENPEIFGIVNEPDTEWLSAEYNPEVNTTNSRNYVIKPEKIGELAGILRDDIETRHYNEGAAPGIHERWLEFRFMEDGKEKNEGYVIYDGYTNTIAFLENPDNFINMTEAGDFFMIFYNGTGTAHSVSDITALLYKNDASLCGVALKEYIRLSDGSFEESIRFSISSSDNKQYAMSAEDEEKAYNALTGLLRGQAAEYFEREQGGITQ